MTDHLYFMNDQSEKVERVMDLLNQGDKTKARALVAEINLTAANRGWTDPDGKSRNWFQLLCDEMTKDFKTVTGKSLA